ncbi:histone acetyltransferase HTATIP [Pancytospora philotis]|nr:histone acetyltransferase HTATIP [Pancytospora philotis]
MHDGRVRIGCKVPIMSPVDGASRIKCEVLALKDDTLYVHYEGLNRRYDAWVPYASLLIADAGDIEQPKKKKDSSKKKTEAKPKEEPGAEPVPSPASMIVDDELVIKNVEKLFIRNYLIDAWYFSPYPKEVIKNGTVYICEFCLYYFSSMEKLSLHSSACTLRHPPGNQIYEDDEVSFFELDGHVQKNYCRNLALISKLFLDHKSLYYDIDVFMFYVLCVRDEYGYQIVGYFSKEKISEQGYNLACILTLPHEQRKGYGKILIDFSYMLSKREKRIAGPEKPLSDLGLLSYRAYWLEVILEELSKDKEASIKELSASTHIAEEDILGTMIAHKMVKYYGNDLVIVLDEQLHRKMLRGRNKKVNPSCLVKDYC